MQSPSRIRRQCNWTKGRPLSAGASCSIAFGSRKVRWSMRPAATGTDGRTEAAFGWTRSPSFFWRYVFLFETQHLFCAYWTNDAASINQQDYRRSTKNFLIPSGRPSCDSGMGSEPYPYPSVGPRYCPNGSPCPLKISINLTACSCVSR